MRSSPPTPGQMILGLTARATNCAAGSPNLTPEETRRGRSIRRGGIGPVSAHSRPRAHGSAWP